jgi:predicted nucleic acid-binding Zn ribbon protein
MDLYMKCTLCGRALPEGERECFYCFPPEKNENIRDEACKNVYELMRKSKAWVLVGFAVIPGWVSHPVSYWFADRASKVYDENLLNNPPLKSKIVRLKIISGTLSLVYWFFTLLYFINLTINS